VQKYLMDILICPSCHGALMWAISDQTSKRIEEAEAHCSVCSRIYPIREGIGLFLTDELQRNDLWKQVDSGLMKYLKSNAGLYSQLMDTKLEALSPADQFFRGMMLEELGEFQEAKVAHDLAIPRLYTKVYLDCFQKQVNYVIDELSGGKEPIIDLASGRCYLVKQLAVKLDRPIVATDFSPQVLRQDRKRLEFEGLYNHISLLAFDARQTPFKDKTIETLTTNLGLPNIEEPGNLLKELRRIVKGTFLSISHFFPENDETNGKAIRKLNLETFMFRQSALESFATNRWNVEIRNVCTGKAVPTAPSSIIEELRNDGLPVSETELEWCTLVAK